MSLSSCPKVEGHFRLAQQQRETFNQNINSFLVSVSVGKRRNSQSVFKVDEDCGVTSRRGVLRAHDVPSFCTGFVCKVPCLRKFDKPKLGHRMSEFWCGYSRAKLPDAISDLLMILSISFLYRVRVPIMLAKNSRSVIDGKLGSPK